MPASITIAPARYTPGFTATYRDGNGLPITVLCAPSPTVEHATTVLARMVEVGMLPAGTTWTVPA